MTISRLFQAEKVKFWSLPANRFLTLLAITAPSLLSFGYLAFAHGFGSAHNPYTPAQLASAFDFSANTLGFIYALIGANLHLSDVSQGRESIWALSAPRRSSLVAVKCWFAFFFTFVNGGLASLCNALTLGSLSGWNSSSLVPAHLLEIGLLELGSLAGLTVLGYGLARAINHRTASLASLFCILAVLPNIAAMVAGNQAKILTSLFPMAGLQAATTLNPAQAFPLEGVPASVFSAPVGLALIWAWACASVAIAMLTRPSAGRRHIVVFRNRHQSSKNQSGALLAPAQSWIRIIYSECFKLLTLRGTWLTIGLIFFAEIFIGARYAAAGPKDFGLLTFLDPVQNYNARHAYLTSAISSSSGVAQLLFAIFGLQFIAAEFDNAGLSRSALASPNRFQLYSAKLVAIMSTSASIAVVAAFASLAPAFGASHLKLWQGLRLGVPEISTILTAGLVFACCAAFGYCLGILLNSTLFACGGILALFVLIPSALGSLQWVVAGTQSVWVYNLHLIFPFAATAIRWQPSDAIIPAVLSNGLMQFDAKAEVLVFLAWLMVLGVTGALVFMRRPIHQRLRSA